MNKRSKRTTPVVVSILGRAGVGKSTFSRELHKRLSEPRSSLTTRLVAPNSRPPLRSVLRSPSAICAYIWAHQAIRPAAVKGWRDLLKMFTLLTARDIVYRSCARNDDVCILDERGVYYSLFWMGLRSRKLSPGISHDLKQFHWFKTSQPDILVVCELDEEEREKRRHHRGSVSDVTIFKKSELKAFYDRNYAAIWPRLNSVAESVRADGHLRILRLDMSAPLEENMQRTMTQILECCQE